MQRGRRAMGNIPTRYKKQLIDDQLWGKVQIITCLGDCAGQKQHPEQTATQNKQEPTTKQNATTHNTIYATSNYRVNFNKSDLAIFCSP